MCFTKHMEFRKRYLHTSFFEASKFRADAVFTAVTKLLSLVMVVRICLYPLCSPSLWAAFLSLSTLLIDGEHLCQDLCILVVIRQSQDGQHPVISRNFL